MECSHDTCVGIFGQDRVLCCGCGRKLCPHDWDFDYCCCTLEAIVERRKMGSNYARLEKEFTYQPPKPGQPERYEAIRNEAKALAHLIDSLVPEGREKSLAFTKLREVVMWANAGIAGEEEVDPIRIGG